jgi:hypothetical protein
MSTKRLKLPAVFVVTIVTLLLLAIAVSVQATPGQTVSSGGFRLQKCSTTTTSAKYVEYTDADKKSGVTGYIVTYSKPLMTLTVRGVIRKTASSGGVEVFKSPAATKVLKHKGLVVIDTIHTAGTFNFQAGTIVKVCQYVGTLGDNKYALMSYPGDLVTIYFKGIAGIVTRQINVLYLTHNPLPTATPTLTSTPTATPTNTATPQPFTLFLCGKNASPDISGTDGAIGSIGDGDPATFKTFDAGGTLISTWVAPGWIVVNAMHNFRAEKPDGSLIDGIWTCFYKGDLRGLPTYRQGLINKQSSRGGPVCLVNIDSNGIITGNCYDPSATPTATP